MTDERTRRSELRRYGYGIGGVTAVLVGIAWIARLAIVETTAAGTVLFELLPPIALLYVGVRALGKFSRSG